MNGSGLTLRAVIVRGEAASPAMPKPIRIAKPILKNGIVKAQLSNHTLCY